MSGMRIILLSGCAAWLSLLAGCQFVPKNQLDASEAQNRMLLEQKNAVLAENENLKTHSRRLEDQVKQAEEELAALDEQLDDHRPRPRSGGLELENEIPASLSARFIALSRRYQGLEFNQQTGASKLDATLLFDRGKAEVRPGATGLLDEFAQLLKSPEARELRVMVVGHADRRQVPGPETREREPDDWHLASARALAVAEYLQSRGVREEQLGMTAFGNHAPLVSNLAPMEPQPGGRVEIFVTGPNTPIVGWTEPGTDRY